MKHNVEIILRCLHECYVPKLNEPYDSRQDTSFDFHNNTISERLNKLYDAIAEFGVTAATDKAEYKLDIVSSLLILIEELQVSGAWCTTESRLGVERLNEMASQYLGYHLYSLLNENKDDYYTTLIFEECLKKLHLKLNSKDWKFHPSLMQVYVRVVHWTKLYDITPNLPVTCPATLLLLDDFSTENKIIGLKCLCVIIERVNRNTYQGTGYDLVILDVLLKLIRIKEIGILERALQCVVMLLPLIMSSGGSTFTQWSKTDDVLEIILNDVYVECDNERKAVYFKYLPELILLHNYRCIRWKKKIVEILCLELGLCVSAQHNHSLLINCLSSLEACTSCCWPVFSYKMDNSIIKILLKVLYSQSLETPHNDVALDKITRILRCFLALCSQSEFEILLKDYDAISSKINNETFVKYWEKVNQD